MVVMVASCQVMSLFLELYYGNVDSALVEGRELEGKNEIKGK